MSRRQRVDFEGAIHHVMNRGVDRQPVFFADADRVEFGYRLAAIHRDFRVTTLAYCLMDNHYHVLLHTPEGRLSEAMQQLSSLYTRHTNDRVGRDGPLFRGRFHSLLVTTDTYLSWVTRYIHRNPLAIAGVRSLADYRWSSYRTYLGSRRAPEFLDTRPVLALHDDDRLRFAATTEGRSVGHHAPLTADDLIQAAEFSIARDELLFGDESESRVLLRPLLMLVADRLAIPNVTATIRDELEFPSARAERMALLRARRRLDDDPALSRVLGALLTDLGLRQRAA